MWGRPLQNSVHNEMVRHCARSLGLEALEGRYVLYSTTSIRIANQDNTEDMIQRFTLSNGPVE